MIHIKTQKILYMVGRKKKLAKEHSVEELEYAYSAMSTDIERQCMLNSVNTMFELAWSDYVENKFRFAGASIFPERASSKWEWTSFIRVWLNSRGFVGYRIDYVFTLMMIASGFHWIDLTLRISSMILCTWVKILKHRYAKTDFIKLEADESLLALYDTVNGDLMNKIKTNI